MTKMNQNIAVRGYSMLTRCADYLQSLVLLVFRLAIGWKIYLSGYRHLSDIPGTVARFVNDFHITFMPTLNVYISGATELAGGILLMLGLATRLISIPLTFNFIVAILTAGSRSVKQFVFGGHLLDPSAYSAGRLSGLEAIIDDTAFPFLLTALLLLAFGPGKASIDYFLKRQVFGNGRPAS